MPVAFDTHALITKLTQGNLPIEQAEAISAALTEALNDVIGTLATKKDLAAVEERITHAEKRLMIYINIYGALTLAALGKLLFFH